MRAQDPISPVRQNEFNEEMYVQFLADQKAREEAIQLLAIKHQKDMSALRGLGGSVASMLPDAQPQKTPWVVSSGIPIIPGLTEYDALITSFSFNDTLFHVWSGATTARANHPKHVIVNTVYLRIIYNDTNFGALVDPEGKLLRIINAIPIGRDMGEDIVTSRFNINLGYTWNRVYTFFLGHGEGTFFSSTPTISANSADGVLCQQFYLDCVAIAYHKNNECLLYSGGMFGQYPYNFESLRAFVLDQRFDAKHRILDLFPYSEYKDDVHYREIMQLQLSPGSTFYAAVPKYAIVAGPTLSYNMQAVWTRVRDRVQWQSINLFTAAVMVCTRLKMTLYYHKTGNVPRSCTYVPASRDHDAHIVHQDKTMSYTADTFVAKVDPEAHCTLFEHIPISIENHRARYEKYRIDVRVRKSLYESYMEEHTRPYLPVCEPQGPAEAAYIIYSTPACPPPYPVSDPMYTLMWQLLA